jgi:hypothetical protein
MHLEYGGISWNLEQAPGPSFLSLGPTLQLNHAQSAPVRPQGSRAHDGGNTRASSSDSEIPAWEAKEETVGTRNFNHFRQRIIERRHNNNQ